MKESDVFTRNVKRLLAAAGVAVAASLAMYGIAQAEGNEIIYAPISTQVNICGNTQNYMSTLNPAFGNTCTNTGGTQNAQITTQGHKKHGHDDD